MPIRKLRYLFTPFLLLSGMAVAQEKIPIEQWRSHLSYFHSNNLAIADQKVYAATENSLFYYDLEDESLSTLSRLEGLSDISITSIAYDPGQKCLLIAYANGNLDILKNNSIKNFSQIRDAQISGSRRINHISFHGKHAYIATDFGFVIFDLVKNIIIETIRNLAHDGSNLRINTIGFYNDSIFLGTEHGAIAAGIQSNLQNYQNYMRYGHANGLPPSFCSSITTINQDIYVGMRHEGMFIRKGTSWEKIELPQTSPLISLDSYNDKILVCLHDKLYIFNILSGSFEPVNDEKITNPQMAKFDEEGNIWISDLNNGLLSNEKGGFLSFTPMGPYSDQVFKVKYLNEKILLLNGGHDLNLSPLQSTKGFSLFNDGFWKSYAPESNSIVVPLPEIKDIVDAVYLPTENTTYFSSFGDGLLKWKGGTSFEVINQSNSPFKADEEGRIYVSGSAVSRENALFFLNYGSDLPLLKYDEGTWTAIGLTTPNAKYGSSLLITQTNEKWINVNPQHGGGIVVFDEKSGKERYLTNAAGNGNIRGNHVTCMSEDREGNVWIGSSQGILYFASPNSVLAGLSIDAIRPIYDGNHLLSDEFITCIKVDGGNRKWIGTRNGLWLISPNGDQIIYQFTISNSPLLSNHIRSLDINDKTGEIFIATNNGVVSFRGTATEASHGHRNVKVFPNPVLGNFRGKVGITGLSYNCQVKITDISGKLIYEMPSEGGTATWDVKDYNGRRASSGIYLIFSSTEYGEDTYVGKIAVID